VRFPFIELLKKILWQAKEGRHKRPHIVHGKSIKMEGDMMVTRARVQLEWGGAFFYGGD
jgi:hypothetical protein